MSIMIQFLRKFGIEYNDEDLEHNSLRPTLKSTKRPASRDPLVKDPISFNKSHFRSLTTDWLNPRNLK